MKNKSQELRIIAQLDPNGVILTKDVLVYINDEPVGALQDIKFHASVDKSTCDLEVTFPDLHSHKIHRSYHDGANLVATVDRMASIFKSFLGVKVILKDLFEDK